MGYGTADKIKDVRALQGIAAGKNEDRRLQVGDIANQFFCLHGCQFQRVASGLRIRAAVTAGKIAGLRGFPDHNQGAPVQIKTRIHCHPSLKALVQMMKVILKCCGHGRCDGGHIAGIGIAISLCDVTFITPANLLVLYTAFAIIHETRH
jgi:hypothetical protein